MDLNVDIASLLAKAFDDFKTSSDKLSSIYRDIYAYEHSSNADYDLKRDALEKTAGVVVFDNEFKIALFNMAAEKLTGLSKGEVLGKYYWDVLGKTPANSIKKGDLREKDRRIEPAPIFAAMEDMIINLAHRMRSPLSAIQLLAELLMQDLDMEKQEMVEDILIGVSSLDAVLSNLLSFAQPIKPNFQRINILAALDESLLFASPSIRQQKISLIRNYSDNEIFCQGDLEQIKQVYFNLILNAIQAMPEGGELYINALYDHIEKSVKVEIQDSGCGISDEDMDRIFAPFYTAKEDATGLGLCIVYKIIQSHGGTIQIKSHPGHGTTVSILLPAWVDQG